MALKDCKECGQEVSTEASACPNCGVPNPSADSSANGVEKTDAAAGCLGLLLGPVGLWYKGQWAAGFAWLAMAVIIGGATGGIALPIFWVGMALHAFAADAQ